MGEHRAVQTAAELFTIVWKSISEVIGTAATATLLRRSAQRATARGAQLEELLFARRDFDHTYTLPASWGASRPDAMNALRAVVRELMVLLPRSCSSASSGHDLRNPLSAVLAGTALLQKRTRDVTETSLISRVTSSTNRALRIINDLLDMTRGRTSGAFAIAPAEGDVAAVMRDLVDEMRLVHTKREILLHGADVLIEATFDADRFAQAIGNLLSNAIQHGAALTSVRVGRADAW